MTFAQLKAALLGTSETTGSAFPLGTPENLRAQCEMFVVEGLIEIQRYIPCWQVGHYDVLKASQVMVQNGCSIVTKPDGEIARVFTVENTPAGWDQSIVYNPVELRYLRRWMGRFRESYRWLGKPFTSLPSSVEGFRMPLSADDSPYGRAVNGIWSIDQRTNRIIVAPWLQSTESVVIEWSGIKRQWADSDLVSDNPDFVRLVRLWLLQEYGRFWNSSDLPVRITTWNDAQSDAILDCQNKNRLPENGEGSSEESSSVASYYAVNPPAPVEDPAAAPALTRIALVGDTGTADSNAYAVADLIKAQSPDFVALLGDAQYEPTLDAALAPYHDFIVAGKIATALGNHDLDHNNGADMAQAIGNPGNGRYFNILIGLVEIFFVNVGQNTAGVYVEPDGSFPGSAQWSNVRQQIARSCALYKIVVLHQSPYTNGARYTPGLAQIRWVSDLEVHAVISAHSHNYERLTIRGRKHFVVGTGGRSPQDIFIPVPTPESEVRKTVFGALILEATPSELKFEFLQVPSLTREAPILDSGVIVGDPPVPSTDPVEIPPPVFPPIPGGPGVDGEGTAGRVAKWTAAKTLGDSLILDDGSKVTVEGAAVMTVPASVWVSDGGTLKTQTLDSLKANLGAGAIPPFYPNIPAFQAVPIVSAIMGVHIQRDANGVAAWFTRDTESTDVSGLFPGTQYVTDFNGGIWLRG